MNHNLREESITEQGFVEARAMSYGYPCVSKLLSPIESRPGIKKMNTELWARENRYHFFDAVRRSMKADFVVTAHHQDDQIETFLFRVFQARMNNMQSLIKTVDTNRYLLRPFLDVSKKLLRAYCQHRELSWVEDESNDSLEYVRNQVRHCVVPQVETVFPEYRKTLSESIDAISEDASVLWKLAKTHTRASLSHIVALDDAIAWRVLCCIAAETVGETAYMIPARNLKKALEHLRNKEARSYSLDLGRGVVLKFDHRSPERLFFLTQADSTQRRSLLRDLSFWSSPLKKNHMLPVPRVWGSEMKMWCFDHTGKDNMSEDASSLGVEDKEHGTWLREDISIREDEMSSLRIGRSCPFERMDLGARGKRRISRLLKESKLDQFAQDDLLYVYSDLRVLWIPGVAAASDLEGEEDLRKIILLLGAVPWQPIKDHALEPPVLGLPCIDFGDVFFEVHQNFKRVLRFFRHVK